MTTIGVFASIFDTAGHALCIRQNYGEHYWTTPGGRLEAGEAPTDTLIREVREEIGAEIDIDGLIGAYANLYKDDLILCFAARLLTSLQDWQPHAEIDALDFFPLDRLPQPMTANTQWRLHDGAAGRHGLYRIFDRPDRLKA